MKKEFQDRIDDYLLGRMTDEERKRFESDIATDAELKEQLQFTETVQQAIKSRNEKLAAMEEWKDDYVWEDESSQVGSSSPFKKILYWVSGIAAIFIVGGLFFNINRPSSHKVAIIASSHPTEVSSYLACIEKDEADIRMKLMLLERDLHSRGESYEDAMTEKDSLETKLVRVLYLKAQALIGLERKDEARVILDEIRHSKSIYGLKADSLYQLLR